MKRKISKRRKNPVIDLKDFRKKKNIKLFTKIIEEIRSVRKRKALEDINLEYLDIFETENEGMIVVTDDINVVYTDLMFDKNGGLILFRQKNPKDKELLNQIVIKRIYSPLSLEENFQAYGIFTNISNMSEKSFLHEFANIFELNITNFSKLIGLAIYDKEENYINNVYIHSNFRRKGLATYLYDYIEADQNIKLKPSNKQLTAGKAFWANRINK